MVRLITTLEWPQHLLLAEGMSGPVLKTAAMTSNSPLSAVTRTSGPLSRRWVMSLDLAPMRDDLRGEVESFLASLDGQINLVRLSPPHRAYPHGAAAGINKSNALSAGTVTWDSSVTWDGGVLWSEGSPYANIGTATAAGVDRLHITGLTADQSIALRAGDFLEVGGNLHMIRSNVRSDSSGETAATIMPPLRKLVSVGDRIILVNPMGRFQIASPDSITIDQSAIFSRASVAFVEYPDFG
jgi:hypothetical protein